MSDCRTDGPGDIGLSALAGPVGFLAQVDLRGETAFAGREWAALLELSARAARPKNG